MMARTWRKVWNVPARSLLAVLLCGQPRVTRAAPTVAPNVAKIRAKVVELVAPSKVVAPPGDALDTAWPLVSPCANPRWFDVVGYREGTLFWSNVSGPEQLIFDHERTDEVLVLPASLTLEHLNRLWVASGQDVEAVYLDCKASDENTPEHSIEWNLIGPEHRYDVTARYVSPTMPRAWRVERWIEPHGAVYPKREKPSRFVMEIGPMRQPPIDVSGPSLRFTRDMLSDLRDLIATTCTRRRCGSAVQSFDMAANKALRDLAARYERLDQVTAEVQPFGHRYEWRVTTGPTRTQVGCYVTSSDQVLCELTLTVSLGQSIHYDAFYSKIELTEPSGAIEFEAKEGGGARLTISGSALALRGRADTGG